MPEPSPKPAPRRRRWRVALVAVVLLGGSLALALRHYTRPDQLTALLVAQARSTLGADLAIDGSASFAFFSHLSVALPHPSLKAHGATTVALRADTLRAVMPWHSLWSDRYDIERIELIKPVVDLDALNAWLASRPASSTAPPDVRFALRVEDATLISGGKTVTQGLNMTFANSGDLAAWLGNIGTASTLPPINGSAEATSVQFGDTRIEGVHVEVHDDAPTRQR